MNTIETVTKIQRDAVIAIAQGMSRAKFAKPATGQDMSQDMTTKTTRTISIVLEIEDMDAAKPIWSSFRDNATILGGKIRSISNDSLVEERDKLENLLEEIAKLAEKLPWSKETDKLIELLGI